MGRREHYTEGQRKVIKKLLSDGKTFVYIRDLLGVSNCLITNAKTFHRKLKPEVSTKKKKQVNGQTICS